MSTERIEGELGLLQAWFGSDLEYLSEGQWVRLLSYTIPSELWHPAIVEVAFQIPAGIPGEQPYGFYVHPGVRAANEEAINAYVYPAATAFGADWGKFSWSPVEWHPNVEVQEGSNMLDFARSFADRFREGP